MSDLRLENFLPYRLSIASNRVSDAIATTYSSLFGLRIPEWRLVAVLAEGDGLSQQALGRATRMDKVTVSRAAISLADRGLITRHSDATDKRAARLSLTAKGRELYDQVAPKALAMEADVFAGFSAGELATFRDMLDRVEGAAAKLDQA
jgi:DNA-binding MarR family transcriptional regulator